MLDALMVLGSVWGHRGFRPGQGEAVGAFTQGRDVVVVLPTGGGKSICYQLPAILAHRGQGPTLVVSPLVALMEDQVAALADRGVPAVALHRGMDSAVRRTALARLRDYAMIYASPERLASASFRRRLREAGIAQVAVDEAHCISEWGHDFRKDYRTLGVLKDELGVPTMALTATATQRVMGDIAASLKLVDPLVVQQGFERPNLSLSVEHHRGDLVVFPELLEHRHHLPRPHAGSPTVQRDGALEVEHRDVLVGGPPLLEPRRGRIAHRPRLEAHPPQVGAVGLLQPLLQLVLVGQLVDEALGHGLGGGERRAGHQLRHGVFGEVAVRGDLGHQLPLQVGHQLAHRLEVRRRRERAGPWLAEGLVGTGRLEVGAQPQVLEQGTEEGELDAQPHQPHLGGGHDETAVDRGRDEHGGVPGGLEEGIDPLVGRP